ncbi:MAG: M4 family metallopeptidase [Chlorobiota bacterium]
MMVWRLSWALFSLSAAIAVALPHTAHVPAELRSLISSQRSIADAPAVPVAHFANEPLPARQVQVETSGAPVQIPTLRLLTPRIAYAPSGAPSWIELPLGVARMYDAPSPLGLGTQRIPELSSVLGVLEQHRSLLKLAEPRRELELISVSTDELGMVHLRFQQVYAGIPVWGADLYVHLRQNGELVLVNGRYYPTPVGVPTQPKLSPAEAIEHAVAAVEQITAVEPLPEELLNLTGAEQARAQLVIFPHPPSGSLRLCYEVTLIANAVEKYLVFVDALSGEVVWRLLNTRTLLPYTPHPSVITKPKLRLPSVPKQHPLATPQMPGRFVDATAADYFGTQRSLRVYHHDDGVHYMIWDLPSYNPNESNPPRQIKGGAVTLTANGQELSRNTPLYHITSTTNTWEDRVAVSAHYHAFLTDRYFRTTHSRNSYNGQGGTVHSILHFTENGLPADNAFWNPGLNVMGFGDGYRLFYPLAASLDAVAHEFTHGVTQYSANLVYQFQPGALNESFSDLFGIMVDRDDFLIGEGIVRVPGKIALRDFGNPGNPQVLSQLPGHMSQYRNLPIEEDNGGVHINCGIPNRAAYLLIQAIGREKAERIFYRVLTRYLTRTSEFIDHRRAVIRAAQELYGQSEAQAAAQAFDAVGIYDSGGGGGGGSGNEVPPVQGGTWYIAFVLSDGRIALLRTSDGRSGVISSSDPRTRVLMTQDGFPLSQLSTARSGERLYFVNQQQQLAYADLTRQQFFIVNLPQLANLRNACISSDGRLASVVRAVVEPFIYITDGQQVARLPLTPQAPDGGAVSTVWLADVMSWTPNMRDPKLAFDAFNVLPLQTGDTLAYWNIYEAHFAGPAIYELVPPNPAEYSLGNITYSNTDPDIIAFNYYSHQTEVYETVLANLQTGQVAVLGTSQWTYNGQPLLDVQRPSFSPDNRYLALVSPGAGLLIVADLQQGQVDGLEVGQPVYHPRWFAVGATGIAYESPQTGNLWAQGLPGGELVLGYVLPEAAQVSLELLDVFGHPVATLIAGQWQPAGRHEHRFQLPSVAGGWYAVRLRWKEEVSVRPFLWLR